MSLLNATQLFFRYDVVPVLDNVSFSVDHGEIVGLIGPNGSGKSTMLRVVLDLLQAQGGSVAINGLDHTSVAARSEALYLASNDYLPQFLTAREYIVMLAKLYNVRLDMEAASELFRRFSMQGRLDHLIEDYSHGMRKKTQLVSALLMRRPLTVIDETLNGIDLEALWTISRELPELRDEEHSVLLVTHDLPLLERLADRIIFLDLGKIVVDAATDKLLSEYGTLEAMVSEWLSSGER